MEELLILESVTERDVDLVLLEELHASPKFAAWLLDRTGVAGSAEYELITAAHSVTHSQLGESDLVALYGSNGDRLAILIENKIAAAAQPDQGARYLKRGAAGIEDGLWSSFQTVMIAPLRYLKASADLKQYGARISYEDVLEWFERLGSPRSIYKAHLLREAIEQNRRGYTAKEDVRVTAFFRTYWEQVSQDFPELEMKDPGIKPTNADWVEFGTGSLPDGMTIFHKLRTGCVDLQISGVGEHLSELEAANTAVLGDRCTMVRTGKSSSVRLIVPPLDRFEPYGEQVPDACQGQRAAFELWVISRAIRLG